MFERLAFRARSAGTPLFVLMAAVLAGCGGSSTPISSGGGGGGSGSAPPDERANIDEQISDAVGDADRRGCDFLDPAYCQFPWPSNALTVEDPDTATGRRLDLKLAGMPMNIVGIPMNPAEHNVDDGFSPGQMMLTHVPELDLERTGAAPVTDIEASLEADTPIFIIDAETGERHPIWIEMDSSNTAATPVCELAPGVSELFGIVGDTPEGLSNALNALSEGCASALAPIFSVLGDVLDGSGLLPNNAFKVDPPALILRPGRNFREGRRYIVAMRDLRDADGDTLEAPATFRVFRDNHASELESVNARREAMEDIFTRLDNQGVAREDLYLAWDFTVRSTQSLAETVLHMRDEALGSLGGGAPSFEVLDVQDFGEGNESIRRVEGRMTVPNYLNTPDGLCDNTPGLSALADYCAGIEDTVSALQGTEAPVIADVADGIADGLELVLRDIGQIPLSRLNYGNPRGVAPEVNPLQPTQEFRFQCEIPRTAIGSFDDADTWIRPAEPLVYGHGLLGSKGEVGGSSTSQLRQLNFMHCAIDWVGMATRDVPSTLLILLEMGQFASLTDRLQQGIINWHFLARLVKHPDGLASDPAFQSADGRPVYSTGRVFYDGNSQGGILNGPVIATSPDITRAVMGVPGMNYSTLLRRSVDFDPYGTFFYAAYPNSFDQSFVLSLVSNLWERGENTAYVNDLRKPDAYRDLGYPTPDHEVLMQIAFGDHQVADLSAEVMTRSLNGAVYRPGVEAGRHSNVNPYWGMPTAVEGERGSVLTVWDIGPLDNDFNEGTATPPTTNTPPRAGRDPHGDPRRESSTAIQRADFLLDERFTDVCAGRPCFSEGYLSDAVASGAAGNAQPLVRAPGPATAAAGGNARVFAIATDPDLDDLAFRWEVADGAACVDTLSDTDQPIASVALMAGCADEEVALRVTVDDGRGGVSSADTKLQILAP